MPWLRATSALTLIAALGACPKEQAQTKAPPPAPADAAPVVVIDAAPPPFPVVTLGKDAAERDGSVGAWAAVIERHRYLQRRKASGIVRGAFFGKGEHGRYLRDLEDGDGLLAIQVEIPVDAEIPEGREVLVWGTWVAKGEGVWLWKASKVAVLPAKVQAPSYSPGLTIEEPRPLPEVAEEPDEVRDGETTVFVVRERPAKIGDGWGVSRVGSTQVVARIVLPGEDGAYGGQDLRAPSERWRLSRGGRYQVKIRKAYRFDNKTDVLFAAGPPAGVLR